MQKTMWYFGTMHITLRMKIMLSLVGAWKKEDEDSRTVAFYGKAEYPWSEENTKHVRELVALNHR